MRDLLTPKKRKMKKRLKKRKGGNRIFIVCAKIDSLHHTITQIDGFSVTKSSSKVLGYI